MDAPPEHEDVGPFLKVAYHLLDRGFAPPRPIAVDRDKGLLLLEDFGDDRVGPLLAREPGRERAIYETAVDILARSEAHTSELQSLMRISYAVLCLKKKTNTYNHNH